MIGRRTLYSHLLNMRRHPISFVRRMTLVCLTLAGCGFVVSHVPLRQIVLMLVVLLSMFAVFVIWNRPTMGILLLIPACLVAPLEIGTGTNTTIHAGLVLVILLLGLWLLDAVVRREGLSLPRSGPTLALLLFVCVAVMAFVGGQLPWFPVSPAPLRAQIGGLFVFVLSAGTFFLVANRVQELGWLRWMTWLYVVICAAFVMGHLVPDLAVHAHSILRDGATGSLSWTWLVALAAGQLLFNRHLSHGARLALLVAIIATMYINIVRIGYWKSGWIPPLVTLAVILMLRWPLLIPVGCTASIALGFHLFPELVASDAYSYQTRLEAWKILTMMLHENPVLGFGPANYYWYTPLYAIRGYYVQFNSHSQYIDILLQTGILGLLCFLWFIWAAVRLAWRMRIRVPEGFARGYVYGALGGLAGVVVACALGDWLLPFVYNIGLSGMRTTIPVWMFLGGLVALQRMSAAGRHLDLAKEPLVQS